MYYSVTVGNDIRIDSSKTICSALKLNFDVKEISRPYAKETILKLKQTLATILTDAKGKD